MPSPNTSPPRLARSVVRASYVEKDRVVRNSSAAPMPGVDCMLDFQLSKREFENVYTQAADRADAPRSATSSPPRKAPKKAKKSDKQILSVLPHTHDNVVAEMRGDRRVPIGDRAIAGRGIDGFADGKRLETPFEAEKYADACRRMAAGMQRATVPDFDGAGELFEKAVDTRARFGLYCCVSNADAHVEYAQNLSKRGLTPEAEYHLRSAADIFRMCEARGARKYGDVLLYVAVVVDRQGRLAEAENFYRSALGVYRKNKLSDDNVRVAIDSLSNNLRAQGRAEEVDTVIQRHFLGAPEKA